MIRIAVCDDNELQRDLMNDLLDYYISGGDREFVINSFASGNELLEDIRKNGSYDIYLLDLIMPGINGMEVAATLRLMKDDGRIIFLTATVEYAVASYDVNAFYYMLKPVDKDRFFKVLTNAVESIESERQVFIVRGKGKETHINPETLMYIELVSRIPRYYLNDGRVLEGVTIRGSFKELVAPLLSDSRFAMCGVSLLVNLSFVDAVDSDSVLMRDGTQLFPPKSAYSEFRKVWKVYQ